MCAREACETSWTVGNQAPAGLLTLARRIGFPLYLRYELGVYYIFSVVLSYEVILKIANYEF